MQKELLARDKERAERNETALTKLQKPGVAAIHALDHEFDPTPLTRAIYERARATRIRTWRLCKCAFSHSLIYIRRFSSTVYIYACLFIARVYVCVYG